MPMNCYLYVPTVNFTASVIRCTCLLICGVDFLFAECHFIDSLYYCILVHAYF